MMTILHYDNKLTEGMCLFGCEAFEHCFLLSSMQQIHVKVLIVQINTFLEQHVQMPQHYVKRYTTVEELDEVEILGTYRQLTVLSPLLI